MKEKNLQRRKNACLSLLFLLFMTMMSNNTYAQDQVATLKHGNDIVVFYGADAFVEAYNAAETDDVITLSGGNFNSCLLEKAITIHGAGPVYDSIAMTEATVLFGRVTISGGLETEHLVVEGVAFHDGVSYLNMAYTEFVKCSFSSLIPLQSSNAYGVGFTNCSVSNYNMKYCTDMVFVNSVVNGANGISGQTTESNIIAYNSCFSFAYYPGNPSENYLKHSDFNNSIIINDGINGAESTCTLNNCICISNGHNSLLQNTTHSNCMEVDSLQQVFQDEGFYVLKDEIATGFLGTDGTQVGIHGGICPWSDRPRYMFIRRCNVGSRTTDDGHLSVDIEVVTEQ